MAILVMSLMECFNLPPFSLIIHVGFTYVINQISSCAGVLQFSYRLNLLPVEPFLPLQLSYNFFLHLPSAEAFGINHDFSSCTVISLIIAFSLQTMGFEVKTQGSRSTQSKTLLTLMGQHIEKTCRRPD
ncbi:hypothetical protein NPIL_380271 [Nephila pilipes]|uniref:Uncharacterized protein n=1 Tax=Nephila pilipes TaxID=299642 RepID=A0A8X6QQ69_NEPPI|nr:hypothetical protein NPIL_380271 [Nephila pilipes]